MTQARIIYVCGNPTYSLDAPSGYATHIRELSEALSSHGLDVSIHLWKNAKSYAGQSVQQVHPLRSWIPAQLWDLLKDLKRLWSDFRFRRRLNRSLVAGKVDLIYERMDYSGPILDRWSQRHRKPYVLEIHAPLAEEVRELQGTRPLESIFRSRRRSAFVRASHVIVVSRLLRRWVEKQGVAFDKITVIPNAVDPAKFNTADRTTKRAREGNETVVGFVGSALRWHGLPELIDAFSQVAAFTAVHLIVVGPANQDKEILALVNQHGLGGKVTFTGPVRYDEVPNWVNTMDICVMASSNAYGSPIKIFEYGIMGKAVIAPDTEPVREVMENGTNGILVPPGDISKLVLALQCLVQDPALRVRLGDSLRERILTQYTWSIAAGRIAACFGELLNHANSSQNSALQQG